MVDLRKLFNILQEICDEPHTLEESDLGDHSAVEVFPDIGGALDELKEGIDEIEGAVKTQKEELEGVVSSLDEIADSLY